jgi:hypothetical protein
MLSYYNVYKLRVDPYSITKYPEFTSQFAYYERRKIKEVNNILWYYMNINLLTKAKLGW